MPKPHLYVHSPTPVFKARVNMASVTYPVSAITYDTVTLGVEADVSFDATLTLGTAEGLDDLGRVRVKTTPEDNSIRISRASRGVEDGQLDIQDNAYITVWDDYRVWAKIPYFDLGDLEDEDDDIDFKDGDVPVGAFNVNIPPVANTGPAVVGYIDSVTGVLTVTFPGGGVDLSYPVADGATLSTYAWDVKDGTITVGSSSDPVITATFPPGFRYISLTVVDSNGVPHTSRCPVLAIDPDDDPSVQHFQANQRLEITGQTLEITLLEDLPRSEYPDGSLVLFWWDSMKSPEDRSHLKFVGWLNTESYDVGRGREGLKKGTKLSCIDVMGRLALLPGFPQALSRLEEESPWSYMPSLDMFKSLYYLLFWHSTAVNLTDFILPSLLATYDVVRLDANGASLAQQIQHQAGKTVPDYLVTCNSQGQIEVRRDWRLDDIGDRPIIAPIITEDNWNGLHIEYNRHPRVHVLKSYAVLSSTELVEWGGVDSIPIIASVAPGDAEAFGQGVSEQVEGEGLALSQEDLNRAEGHRYAMLNARFGDFTFLDPTGVDFWDYEPAEMKRVQLNVGASYAMQRGLPFTQAIGMVQSIQVQYIINEKGLLIKPSVTFQKETSGFPAITVVLEEPEEVGYVPTPEPSPLSPDYGLWEGQSQIVALDGKLYNTGSPILYRTDNFEANPPTWNGVTLSISRPILSFVVDPFSPGYITGSGPINAFVTTPTAIYKLTDLFGTVGETLLHTFPFAASGSEKQARTIQASFGRYFEEDSDNPWLVVVSYYANTSGHTGTWATYSIDGGQSWSDEVQLSPHYDFTSGSGVWPAYTYYFPAVYCSPRTPGLVYTFAHTTTAAGTTPSEGSCFVSTDWGETWSQKNDPLLNQGRLLGGSIHIPWQDNEDERIIYHGRHYGGGTFSASRFVELRRCTDDFIEDASPVNPELVSHGPIRGQFGVRAYDADRQFMAMCGMSDEGSNSYLAPFVSTNGGDSWSQLSTKVNTNSTNPMPEEIAFAADNPNILYLWGRNGYFYYSGDFGETLENKRGTISSTSSIIGIAGGPTG